MKAFAQNTEIDPGTIGPPTMNYGQHQRLSPEHRSEYRFEMSAEEFRLKVERCFEEFRHGEIHDIYDEEDASEFPQLFEWQSKEYPPLEALMDGAPNLLVKLLKYWEYDISHALSEFSRLEPAQWIVMSIDDIQLSPELVVVTGSAYNRLNSTV